MQVYVIMIKFIQYITFFKAKILILIFFKIIYMIHHFFIRLNTLNSKLNI